jgi:hypothetical protein
MRRAAVIAGLFLMLPILVAAAPASSQDLERGGTALAAASHEGVIVAEASCASLCRQRHNQCRISTRGAPRCDAELQRCLKGCLGDSRRR